MTIWALKGPSYSDYDEKELLETREFLANSIKNGTSRFGWGYVDTADLTTLKDKPWQEMTGEEQKCWSKAYFLLEVKKDDWIVHINLPDWGECIAGQVLGTYSFEQKGNDFGDYRHLLQLEKSTIVEFERNADEVLPVISSRLKLQGSHWTIRYVDEFKQTIKNINSESLGKKENESVGLFYLKQDLSPLFKEITNRVQKAHPAGKLENFIAEVLRKIPNVINVIEYGQHKGWGTDNGADLIVTYKSGLSFINLEEEKLVVQVKSFTGQHWETNAVNQITDAIKEFEAAAGLIITSAESTKVLEDEIKKQRNELNKPIRLIAGEEVAKFVLKYGGELIL